ncbi:Variant surface glycoprotein [Trypanosoma congolense IL3000]|uniref:Variant surface glycoprotein n=1 Tax=Trypanosoma congolense (strain IL3000) TaxID=1068625 RepID=F9WAF3_TRYCI|nr:Variant surface glycoprotein [Trypanosoma congolense IL3000]
MIENRTMKIWIIAILLVSVVGVCAQESGESTVETDHNKEEHDRLCNVLKAAVGKWGTNGEGLTDPLKKALGRTIFGNEEGGSLGELKEKCPDVYDDVGGWRWTLCGQLQEEEGYTTVHQPRWPGHSASHDLVCLCTVGHGGWPLNEAGNTGTTEKLCGKDKNALGASGKQGWGSSGTQHGKEQIRATWTTVVKECLKGEQEKDLRGSLETFIWKLNHTMHKGYKNLYLLGKGNITSDEACDGTPKKGVCVRYFPNMTDTKTWWLDLKNAIEEDEAEKKRKLAEDTPRGKQEETIKPELARAEPIKSGPTTTNQAEAPKNDNLQDKLRRYNLTSGTPISLPSSWLLSAVFLF